MEVVVNSGHFTEKADEGVTGMTYPRVGDLPVRVALDPCYILHLRPYRESSLLLQVFSTACGRIDLLAKGARRGKNLEQHLFRPLQRLLLSWVIRGELGTVTGIEKDGMLMRAERPEQLYCMFYVNELVLRLLHRHESHPELFHAYADTLDRLWRRERPDVVLRYFEKQLLEYLGYGLILDRDVDEGSPLSAGRNYFYRVDAGPSRRDDGAVDSVRISGKALLALHENCLETQPPVVLRELKCLMRGVLDRHLGGKSLASRELYGRHLQFSLG